MSSSGSANTARRTSRASSSSGRSSTHCRRVDMREIPVPGDRQEVITSDNVVVTVNATIFTQIVDAKQALFSVANFGIAIDALARTALRSVIGTLSLDEALSERERINTDVQSQMEAVTDKWGIRIARIEIVEITPPPKILEALGLAEAGRPGEAGQDPAIRGQPAIGDQHRRRRGEGRHRRRGRACLGDLHADCIALRLKICTLCGYLLCKPGPREYSAAV